MWTQNVYILRTKGESRSMFCECICPPVVFFAYLLCRDNPPPPETLPSQLQPKNNKKTTYNIFAPVDTERGKKKTHVLVSKQRNHAHHVITCQIKWMQHVLSEPQGRFRKPSAVSIPARACLTRSTCLNSFILNFDSHSHSFIYQFFCVIKLTCDCCGWNSPSYSSVG